MNAQHIQIDSLNARFGNRVLRADEVTKCRLMGVLPCDCGCGLPTMLMYFIRIEGYEPSNEMKRLFTTPVELGYNNRLHVEVLDSRQSVVYYDP